MLGLIILEPIIRTRLSDQIVERLKKYIADNNLKLGDRLPSERKIMKELHTGRTVVREALRILENMGLIEVRPGKGAFITDPTYRMFTWISFQQDVLSEHFEIRLIIEPRAASLAAERGTKEAILKIRAAHNNYISKLEEDCLEEIIKADAIFHSCVANATQNRTLSILMKTMSSSLLEGWNATLGIPERVQKTVEEHEDITKAIEDRMSEKAASMMKRHLNNAIADLKKFGFKHNDS